MTRITSTHNQQVKQIRALRLRKVREERGLFLIEGQLALRTALARGAAIELVVVAPELGTAPRELLGQTTLEVSAEVFASISSKATSRGVAAVVRQRWASLEQLRLAQGYATILEGCQYPGNLGTIVRTADASGAAGLILVGATADPYDLLAVRASTSALFAQTLVRADYAAIGRWKRQHGVALVGASPDARADFRSIVYPNPVSLVFGSEGGGLSPHMRALCDELVCIPMAGESDSLNLAVAAGVVMYEVARQHGLLQRSIRA
jgi:TrmH family RNA methyltransferase